ncbi:MAG: hypothetical protein CMJ31_09035 [Phycisphaerae bacterium]|nr:hypothetical protein [Phycisphaerae bacterium]
MSRSPSAIGSLRRRLTAAAPRIVGVASACLITTLAAGQNAARPPAPTQDPSGAALTSALIGIIFAALALFAASLRSKRGHND